MQLRVPKRLVDVDVPETGQRALIEESCLQRRTAAFQPLAQPLRRERGHERLLAEPRTEIRLELAGLEQQPRAETADVAVADLGAVVETQQRSDVRAADGIAQEAAGHAEVDQERASGREADDQVLAAPVDAVDALAGQLGRDLERVVRAREPDVVDLDVLEPATLQRRRDRAPDAL